MVKRLRKSAQYIRRYLTEYASFLPCRTRSSIMSFVNSEVTGPKFTNFLHDRYTCIIYAVNAHIEVAITHSVSECQRDKSEKFEIFPQNWLPWQRPLRYRKKRSRSIIYTQNAFIRRKDCENRSRRS